MRCKRRASTEELVLIRLIWRVGDLVVNGDWTDSVKLYYIRTSFFFLLFFPGASALQRGVTNPATKPNIMVYRVLYMPARS